LTISDELAIRQKLKDDFPHYASRCLKIRTKSGAIEPLILSRTQQYLHAIAEKQRKETGRVRIIVVKGRQQYISTYIEGRFYWRVTHRKGVRAYILTHEDEATKNLFEMASRYHDHCPEIVRPHTGAANANELSFDLLDSGYKVGTARTKGTGRSSTLQYFHGSEVALWPNAEEHASGVLQAIPSAADTEVFLESTGYGIGNWFHQTWQQAEAGEGDYIAVFIPWYWQDEYRRDPGAEFVLSPEEAAYASFFKLDAKQMAWRRAKIIELKSEKLFKQEYPATAAEAFQVTGVDSLIGSEFIMAARKAVVDPYGPLVVGVDPAGEGKDRTAIAFRRSRKCTKIDTYIHKRPMEIVSICARILKNHQPAAMFIDVGERGSGIVDRLRELGWDNVIGVNFGSRAIQDKLYMRRRDEMWCLLRDWLEAGQVQIPDDDALHADLAGPSGGPNSNNQMILERKEDMAKRGLRSPDMGDALALTFAEPVSAPMKPLPEQIPEYFGVAE
jgi:hypothetical protein